tara:strand:+ start:1553 stop:1786 length:234 start_codon:yes stop_codon:yes gene_type:complete
MLRKMMKRVLFGKRKNYRRRYTDNNVKHWELKHLHNEINDAHRKLHNLMYHLGLKSIGNSNLVGDKKDGKKFDGQWN